MTVTSTSSVQRQPVRIFCSYSHHDARHVERLLVSVSPLRREGLIEEWYDGKILPGEQWADLIAEQQDVAGIILLLISSDFLASDFCYGKEMRRAMERHHAEGTAIVPIIVRSADWESAPFAELQALPRGGKPITEWANRDRAWTEVAKGIRKLILPMESPSLARDTLGLDANTHPLEALPVDESVDSLATALPAYEILHQIGRGAFGIVWLARHRELGRHVAVKEFSSGLLQDADERLRFQQEARILALLSHSHICAIYDYASSGVIVMEYLQGGTLWSVFLDQGLTRETACGAAIIACQALQYAHEHGILHLDIKPENLRFSSDRILKLCDFGISTLLGATKEGDHRRPEIVGTPAYMAPEQAEGGPLTPAADVFATGAMLYELLTGRLPYSEEGGALALVYRHVHEDAIDIREIATDVPSGVAEVTMKALARSPADRYESAQDFGLALASTCKSEFGLGWLRRGEIELVGPGPLRDIALSS